MARRALASAALLLVVHLLSAVHSGALAQDQPGGRELVKNARNPLADRTSLQVQANFNFGVGQDRDTQYVFVDEPRDREVADRPDGRRHSHRRVVAGGGAGEQPVVVSR